MFSCLEVVLLLKPHINDQTQIEYIIHYPLSIEAFLITRDLHLARFYKSVNQNNDKAPHVLNASSNLLGICFIVLTSFKVLKLSEKTLIDEVTIGAIILFMTSCILSFLSIRNSTRYSRLLENIADIVFLSGLFLLFITTLLFSFNVIS